MIQNDENTRILTETSATMEGEGDSATAKSHMLTEVGNKRTDAVVRN